MTKSRLLNHGAEEAVIYPQRQVVNRRGETSYVDSPEGFKVHVTVSEDKQSVAELPGQVSIKAVRLVFRWPYEEDIGVYGRVHYRDEQWDFGAPPHYQPGATRASAHYHLLLKSRNKLGGK